VGALALVAAALAWTLLSGGPTRPEEPGGERPPDLSVPSVPPTAWLNADRIGFAPIPIDAARLEAARDELDKGPAPDSALSDSVLEAFFRLNRLDAETASDAVRRPVQNSLHIRLREMVSLSGKAGLFTFLDQTWPAFEAALNHIAAAVGPDQTVLERVAAPPDALAADVGWAGGFVVLAHQLGMMDDRGRIEPRLMPVVQVLYRYRWATTLTGVLDPRELLTRDEYTLLTLWRLQEARNVPSDRRLRYAHEASLLIPDYPLAAAEGVVHFEAGRPEEARLRFAAALEQQPELKGTVQGWIRQLEQPPSPAP